MHPALCGSDVVESRTYYVISLSDVAVSSAATYGEMQVVPENVVHH